ncbi:hypothetical protein [Paludibacterium paludis]|nr:hypothetical protein [Paludibacterium paludis]
MLAAPCLAAAAYDPTDRFYLYAEAGYLSDSNVLRLNEKLESPRQFGYGGASDRIVTTTVGGHYDTTFSRQRFTLDGKFSDTRYDRFSRLDYHSWTARSAWNWALASRWTGTIGYSDSKNQSSIEDAAGGVRDVIRDRVLDGRAVFALTSRIGLEFSGQRKAERREVRFNNNFNQDTFGLGLVTSTEKGSMLAVRAQKSDITYVWLKNFIGSQASYRQTQFSVSARWPVTAKTTLSASTGWVRNEGNGGTQGGSRNRIGSFEWNWNADAKNTFAASYSRQSDTPGNNTIPSVLTSYSGSWQYLPTAKTQVSARTSESTRKYATSLGNERTRLYNITLSWKPMTQLELSTFAQNVVFKGTSPLNDYKVNQYGVNARVFY